MVARAVREALPGADKGDVDIQCEYDRLFGMCQHDTAVCIDLQTDFVDSANGRLAKFYDPKKLEAVSAAVANAARLLAAARKAGLTVAHSRSHRYGASIRRDLVGVGDAGYELFPAVAAMPGEIVVDKWTFGAFASTQLEAELRARGVRRILLCGVLTNVCVFATAVQAVDRFFRVCLVEDACASFSRDWHENAVKLINEPQRVPGHAQKATGLYFGEVSTVDRVQAALKSLP
ncbi:cysteine hydrolase [Pelagophyceae sp. CCMP2097]|nr:cysteine hydrolase [Pelagophyceae sp. CCMP2097]